jgi:hypothetical protein
MPKKHCLGPQNGPGSTERCNDMKNYKIRQLDYVGGHQYPPGICVGLQTASKVYNPQLQIRKEERVELKIVKRIQLE